MVVDGLLKFTVLDKFTELPKQIVEFDAVAEAAGNGLTVTDTGVPELGA
jgi:hypothetical protein